MGSKEAAHDAETAHRRGVSVQALCRKHGISDATFYKWRTKYDGLEVSDVKKLRQLKEENRRPEGAH